MDGGWIKSAVLVESVRTDRGPRQRHVAYLGTIREGCEGMYRNRVDFWRKVDYQLDQVGPVILPRAERARIVAVLAAVVPRPDGVSQAAACD
jgi:hypothetical protein